MPKDWVIAPPWEARDRLAMALRVSPIVAQVLYNRGICDEAAARQFLSPKMGDMAAPETLPGAIEAADRITSAIEAGRKIVIYGDYDVDGITGVAILWHCLKLAGANVEFYVPRRLEEGYGVNAEAIESIADDGAGMIVTVDCGVTAIEPAARARELGVEFIITDHHNAHTDENGVVQLPDAIIVHPALARNGASSYPNPNLSGAGVALKLAWAIAQKLSNSQKVSPAYRDFLIDAMGLAALGTIADVVPLLGENRVIAQNGLRGLPSSRLAGIKALIQSANLTGQTLGGYEIGFKLAPRLNAIGRMGHALLAVEMLTRADEAEAVRIAKNLNQHNADRQRVQSRIAREARDMVIAEGQNADGVRGIVLASGEWHAGVIGIVASKVMEEFGRPTVMIALENGVGQGSGRSIRNFALHEAFAHCREHLISYGGHAMAAGLRIESSKVEEFRAAFQNRAGQLLTPGDLRARLMIDDVVSLADLTEQLLADFNRMEPFGAGNAAPRLATDWLHLAAEPKTVGASGTHLQVQLTDGHQTCRGIGFGMGRHADDLRNHRRCRVAFQPKVNEWMGKRSVEMQILDFRFPD
ncbi:MAG: single-stranded-DNA-specific exonuclease RecJ [Phycisphaerae bacterium]|nr:single-stranded-DNA-specific exonuclease RecJ [Phycisphaerae bacterium]